MIEIHLDTVKLWAMHLLAGQQDMRPFLNGVRIEANASETRMVATNGHIAGWLRQAGVDGAQNVCDGVMAFTVPNDIIERMKPGKVAVPAATVLIDVEGAYRMRLWDGTLIPFTPAAGTYPDHSRIRPQGETNGIGCQLNGEYLELFAKVNKLLTGARFPRSLQITFNGPTTAARVQFENYPAFFGVIMAAKVTAPVQDLGWSWSEPTSEGDAVPDAEHESVSA